MTSPSGKVAPLAPGLVPELLVTDLVTSLHFWVTLCGFEILYDRPEEGFAYLHSRTAHVMLEQIGVGRNWIPGSLESPLGRGVNFQVGVPTIAPVVERLAAAGWLLFMAPETKWYQTGDTEAGVSQFLVQDPDGYLIRFASPLK
ncbi:bleomycin resistance protein [Arthrobacter sp. CG_A4]|uniref:bleomycin resistance protein n=1 Tax=Arthrobacter sp. CG_A4 TaxID=3071706 RepID=UPI002E02E002|nr:catechol 2,3-dioxygenase-like lactoylglutathione lyase family enzyme [Arthrobacter sp. CG_A4]